MKNKLFQFLQFHVFSFIVTAGVFTSSVYAEVSETRTALLGLASKVKMVTLPNGLRVIAYKRGTAPVFAGTVTVRVGGTDEAEGSTGISHMFEHMAFKGTQTLGTKNYRKEKVLLDELEIYEGKRSQGVALSKKEEERLAVVQDELAKLWVTAEFAKQYDERGGTGMNATTDTELTRYFVELPRTAFEFWCAIESDRILNPVMRQFYKERDIVMEERRMRVDDDPQGKLYELLLGMAYRQHPYRNPVIGYSDDIKRLTASQTDSFRKKYYVPGNMVVSLVGDVDLQRDLPLITKYFGKIPRGGEVPRPRVVEPKQEGERRFVLEDKASQHIAIVYRKPNYPDHDDPPLTLLAQILAGSKISPLYTELVKRSQKVVDISYGEDPGSAYPNLLSFTLVPRSPHTNEEVLSAFDAVIKKFLRTKVSEETLTIAKRSMAVDYLGHMKSNSSLALDFASSELYYGSWRALIDWYDSAMAVTTDDIMRVAAQYLTKENRTIGMIESKR